jgi:putative FmdB family regulatory protein
MPTYEYRCTQCEAPLEVVQSIHEAALTECPTCGGRLRKVFGNVGVVFKGSGFYRTDSRGKSAAGAPAKTERAGKPSDTATAGDSPAAAPAATGAGAASSGSDGGASTTSGTASKAAPAPAAT